MALSPHVKRPKQLAVDAEHHCVYGQHVIARSGQKPACAPQGHDIATGRSFRGQHSGNASHVSDRNAFGAVKGLPCRVVIDLDQIDGVHDGVGNIQGREVTGHQHVVFQNAGDRRPLVHHVLPDPPVAFETADLARGKLGIGGGRGPRPFDRVAAFDRRDADWRNAKRLELGLHEAQSARLAVEVYKKDRIAQHLPRLVNEPIGPVP